MAKKTIIAELESLVKDIQAQIENFKQVPEPQLEKFLEDVVLDQIDNYSDERLETREYQLVALVLEADVRHADNIGHCGSTTDYFWEKGSWVTEWDHEDECQECGGTLSPDGSSGCENPDCVNHESGEEEESE